MKNNTLALILFVFGVVLNANSQTVQYKWDNLKIGGGGYVTGLVVHPKDKDIRYIRTDVGGAYKWDIKGEKWVQLLNWVDPANENLIGVDGMALDPNRPSRVYLALGKRIDRDGGLYRSEDMGVTWTRLFAAHFEGNGREARWIGECIAIDPNSSETIYVGTRKEGLWRSIDDGKTWTKIDDIPNGFTDTNPTGIRTIVFDPIEGNKAHSSIVYVGILGKGIYYSMNAGETFAHLPGSPVNPARMQVVNRELFVTHDSGVTFWSNGSWYDISPSTGRNYVGVTVDVDDSRKIVVAQRDRTMNNPIYRSDNKGKTWQQINTSEVPANQYRHVPWWPKSWFSSATSTMSFGAQGSGELFFTDWFGVWQTSDIWAKSTDWVTHVKGHEETVVLTLVSPPTGALVYSGLADVFGFKHVDIRDYPAKRLYPLSNCFSIAVCEQLPANIAILGAKTWEGDKTQLFTSSDFGETWIDRTLPEGSILGRIAVSPTRPDQMVYISGGGKVYYTLNQGADWILSHGSPQNVLTFKNVWNRDSPLAADLVGEVFYIFQEGILYSSTDGGANWGIKNKKPIPQASENTGVVPAPGREGEVWLNLDENGLWKTSNGGITFTQIKAIGHARAFSWGVPAPGSRNPTAYCYGTIKEKWGLYRSIDLGENWVQINDDENHFPSGVKAIAGDRQMFGRVYVGSGGLGVFYGQPLE